MDFRRTKQPNKCFSKSGNTQISTGQVVLDETFEIFNKIVGYSNHLGLFSEDLDFETKRQLGNFPQAYSHLALINTASLFTEERPISKFIRP